MGEKWPKGGVLKSGCERVGWADSSVRGLLMCGENRRVGTGGGGGGVTDSLRLGTNCETKAPPPF